jgi:hypothetical protein
LLVPSQIEKAEIIQSLIDSTKNDSFMNKQPGEKIQLMSNYDMSACMLNCSGNGVCKFSNNKYSCICFPDYVGEKCQTNSRPCTNYPCLNNGECFDFLNVNQTILTNQKVWDFSCNCSQFYFGERCESKINVCQNETCSGNGHCFDNSSVATCKCFIYFSGPRCEIEESQLKTIKQVISVTAITAILLISAFYLSFFVMDIIKLSSIFQEKNQKVSRKELPKIKEEIKVKPVYTP